MSLTAAAKSRCMSRFIWRGRLYPRISLTSQILSFARRYLSDLRQPWCVSDCGNKQTATYAEGRDETAQVLTVAFYKRRVPRHFYVNRDGWSLVISWRHPILNATKWTWFCGYLWFICHYWTNAVISLTEF